MRVLGLPMDVGNPKEVLSEPIVRAPIRAVGTYRIKQPLDAMAQQGLAEIDYFSAGFPLVYELVRDFDVVIMQRQTMAHHISLLEHVSMLLGNLAVYDFDDDLLNLDPMSPSYVHWGSDKGKVWEAFCRIRDGSDGEVDPNARNLTQDQVWHAARIIRAGFMEMLHVADLLTVSTPYLKQKYSAFTEKPIEVIPNAVRFEDWFELEPLRIPGTEDKFVIGWAGGQSHMRDLLLIVRPILNALDMEKNAVLVIAGFPEAKDLFPDIYHDRIFTMPFMKMNEYRGYVKGFDIGLAPAAAVSQNYGKSPIRVFELGMCGVPVVASATTYEDVIPSDCGYVARTPRQFWKGIGKLIRMGSEARKEMGNRLQQYVISNHEIKQTANLMAEVYAAHLERKRRNGS